MEKSSNSFLTENLSSVRTSIDWFPYHQFPSFDDLIFDPKAFVKEANTYRTLRILTYSVTKSPLLERATHLIVGIKPGSRLPTKAEVRHHPSLHSKLYLCYGRCRVLKAAYVGSQNLVQTTTFNLMMKITNRTKCQKLEEYFDLIWRDSTKL